MNALKLCLCLLALSFAPLTLYAQEDAAISLANLQPITPENAHQLTQISFVSCGGEPDGSASAVSWSTDGQLLAVTQNETRCFYSVNNLVEPLPYESDGDFMGFVPDGRVLVRHSADDVRLLDLNTGEETAFKVHLSPYSGYVFSPDNRYIITDAHGGIRIFDVESGELLVETDLPAGTVPRAFNTDGTWLSTVGGGLQLWQIFPGPQAWQRTVINGPQVISDFGGPDDSLIAFEGDAQFGLTAETEITIWDVEAEQRLASLISTNMYSRILRFMPDGNILLAGGTTLRLWDVSQQILLGGWPIPSVYADPRFPNRLTALAVHPSGKLIITGEADGAVRIWGISEPLTPQLSPTVELPNYGRAASLVFNPDMSTLAVLNEDGSVYVWDIAEQMERLTLPANAQAVRFNGDEIITLDDEGVVKLWDSQTGSLLETLQPEYHPSMPEVWASAISPNSTSVVQGGAVITEDDPGTESVWWLWNFRTGYERTEVFFGRLTDLDFAPNSVGVLITSQAPHCVRAGSGIRVIDISTRRVLFGQNRIFTDKYFRNYLEGMFDPSGTRLLSVGLRRNCTVPTDVWLWNLGTGEVESELAMFDEPHLEAITYNGNLFAVGLSDNSIHVRQIADPETDFALLYGHSSPATALAFSPDGRWLASGDEIGNVYLWELLDTNQTLE